MLEKYTVPEGTYANDKLLGELHVNMSNILIRAAHGLNLVEKRIISVGVAKIDSMRIGTHEDFNQMTVRLDATVYGEEYGVDMKNAYAELRRASESLFEKYINIPKQTRNGLKEHKFRWVSGVLYHHGEGWIEINFTREVMPYISLLRKDYTSYKLKMASALRSVYSWRLLELLKSWRSTKTLYISLEELKRSLEVPDSYAYINVRQRCIEPAVKELREKSGIIINWKPIKKGRAVKSFEFRWKEDEQLPLTLPEDGTAKPKKKRTQKRDNPPPSVDIGYIEKHARPGESYQQAKHRLSKSRR